MFMDNKHYYETLVLRCCLTGNLVDPVALSVVTFTEWHNTVRRLRDTELPNTQDGNTETTDYWNKHFHGRPWADFA